MRISILILNLSFIFCTINFIDSSENIYITDNEYELITLPTFEINSDIEDSRRFKYGHKYDVNLGIHNSGTWNTSNQSNNIWRLAIKSIDAYALKIQFNEIYLPEYS